MVNLANELNELQRLLEATIPANPASHERQAKELERELRKYFKGMAEMIPEDKIEALYYRYVEQE